MIAGTATSRHGIGVLRAMRHIMPSCAVAHPSTIVISGLKTDGSG